MILPLIGGQFSLEIIQSLVVVYRLRARRLGCQPLTRKMSTFTYQGRVLLISAWLLAVGSAPAGAGPLEDGQAAYDSGQLRKAYEAWLPLAEAGNCRAQYWVSKVIEDLGTSYLLYGEVESDDSWAYRTFGETWERNPLWVTWRLRAAQQGHGYSQQWFAELFWDKVRDLGFVDAIVYEPSEEPPPDPAKSLEQTRKWQVALAAYETIAWTWTILAADSGHPDAMILLRDRAGERGEVAQALMWDMLAYDLAYPLDAIPDVADDTPYSPALRAMAEAERRAAAWRAAHAYLLPWGACGG